MLTCKSNSNKRSVRFIDGLSWFKGFAILVHAIRINIHNKASKEREWTSEFQFKFKHRELMCTFRWSSTNLYLRISIPLGRLIVFNFDNNPCNIWFFFLFISSFFFIITKQIRSFTNQQPFFLSSQKQNWFFSN